MKLGDRVRDRITGFIGIAIGKSDFLTGCTRWLIQGEKLKDGIPTDPQSFDETQLEIVTAPRVRRAKRTTFGGPQPTVARRGRDARATWRSKITRR